MKIFKFLLLISCINFLQCQSEPAIDDLTIILEITKNTIIWQRTIETPQKVEYFRETVDEKFYEIIGWGYYSEDDLSLSPPFWFYGKYERIE